MDSFEVLISEQEIERRVRALGQEIMADYAGKPLTIVAVLTGSLVMLADLMRQVAMPHRVALVQASSYRGARTTAGDLAVSEAFLVDVAGRHVLLLDDILDTGRTLSEIARRLESRQPLSVRSAVLLRKIGRQVVPFEPDYIGFTIPDEFVVGYGLDFDDDYRHLPYIAVYRPGAS